MHSTIVPPAVTRPTRLWEIRESLDLTREFLASDAQIAVRTLVNAERGLVKPTRATKFMVAAALRLDVEDVFPENENEREDQSRSISKLAAAGGHDEAYP